MIKTIEIDVDDLKLAISAMRELANVMTTQAEYFELAADRIVDAIDRLEVPEAEMSAGGGEGADTEG